MKLRNSINPFPFADSGDDIICIIVSNLLVLIFAG